MIGKKIRVLVDRSRDSGWSEALVNLEPDDVYQMTDNSDYLNWSILKNYDVLTVCSYSPLQYKNEELESIKRFVESGGGLLLASSTSRFHQDSDRQSSDMGINKVARLFGAEFLFPDRCRGETEFDPCRK